MSMIGKTLAHYDITSELGKGGMGEVYRARDRKLDRDVAIKILPEEFAKDADRIARFQREAKLLASLNHPGIAAIHGLEESNGTNFLVLELVEGETLADRLKRGAIPLEESLKLALQIVEALESAHEKGIIHRDLKPANIKVTPEGKVKVLDFGLAKAFAGEQAETNLSNSPTLSDLATQRGIILGTAAYMPPEQARGMIVDKRADIWAFGCVLFEMLTGRPAFSGKDVTDILAAVIRSDPEWSSLPWNLHERLREVIERCLKKEPGDRYHDISDVRLDIQRVLADPGGVLIQPKKDVEPRTRLRTVLPWVSAAVLLTAAAAGAAFWMLRPHEPHRVVRFDYGLPEGQQLSDANASVLAASPDGEHFAYSTPKGLYLRSVNEWTAKLIPGTEGPTQQPFFSPDGECVGYFTPTTNQLKRIAVSGGASIVLCNVDDLYGASWTADNTIVYGTAGGIMKVSANGGTPEFLLKSEPMLFLDPQILPDGESVLFTSLNYQPHRIMVQSLKSGKRKALFAGDAARYLPTGHIVYASGDNLWAVPFDPGSLEPAGGPVSIVEGVFHSTVPLYAVSDSGMLVYVHGTTAATTATSTTSPAAAGRTLVWVDREGKEESLAAPPNAYNFPMISPDGTRVALSVNVDSNMDIYVWDLVRNTLARLTFDKALDVTPIWTPDGKRILYFSFRGGKAGAVYRKAADGTGKEELIGSAPDRVLIPSSLSRDGKDLVVTEVDLSLTKRSIGILSMEGDHALKSILQEGNFFTEPSMSPDGHWIAYASGESSNAPTQIYVRPFPEVDKGMWQVSTHGGSSPLWSRDGKELFYFGSENSVMAVAVETKPSFSLGTPKRLFQSIYQRSDYSLGSDWDLSSDGKRFLMIKIPGTTGKVASEAVPRSINVVLNWLEELKERVQAK
jgi:serine/threonine protein kinase